MFENKRFRVVRNDGPGAEVTTDTVFHFHQTGDIIHVDYWGGAVRFGQMLGLVEGDRIRHRYVQINTAGAFHTGHSTIAIEQTEAGLLRLVDSWEWESKAGHGLCIFEELP